MALETSDLNDQALLDATRQETDSKGNFRLKIVLPDGHPLQSEWIPNDKKSTKLILDWLETVRSTAAARSREREEEMRAKMRRENDEKRKLIVPPAEEEKELDLKGLLAITSQVEATNPASRVLIQQAEEFERKAKALREAAELISKAGV